MRLIFGSCLAVLIGMLTAFAQDPARACFLFGPAYQLASDTVQWSMTIGQGQSCIRGVKSALATLDQVQLIVPPKSGNFLFHAGTMLREIERFEPAMADAVKTALANVRRDLDFTRLPAESFGRAPTKSIDFAVLERTDSAAVLSVDFGWSDVGNWDSVWEMLDHDEAGNATQGTVVIHNSRNSLVRSEDSILTALVGLDNVVVVSTADAVLVAARSNAEQLKALVHEIKLRNHPAAVEHRRIHRPWGYFQEIDSAGRFKVKRIVVKPGAALSLQKHFHRSEHWVVVRGTAEVTVDDAVQNIHENESIYIPIGSRHRLANPGKIDLELIEVQVGSYLGEDDIVRFDDVYGRENSHEISTLT